MLTSIGTVRRNRGSSREPVHREPSGDVASPLQAANKRRVGNIRNFRETASRRASLNVYVICLSFHCSPCTSPNRSLSTTATLGLKNSIGRNRNLLNPYFLDSCGL